MPSGSLNNDVFERRKSTGSGRFADLGRDFDQFLDQIVSMIEKTFRNTNLIASRHLRREKNPLPVDVRHLTCCLARILYKETSPCNRVLKCDVIKMKFLKLWDLSEYSEREFLGRPPQKIRRVCMEFSEHNRLTSQRQFAPKCSLLASRPLGHCSFKIP